MQNTILSSVSNQSNDANPCAWARKTSVWKRRDGRGTGWNTLVFVRWHFLFFVFKSVVNYLLCRFFGLRTTYEGT